MVIVTPVGVTSRQSVFEFNVSNSNISTVSIELNKWHSIVSIVQFNNGIGWVYIQNALTSEPIAVGAIVGTSVQNTAIARMYCGNYRSNRIEIYLTSATTANMYVMVLWRETT